MKKLTLSITMALAMTLLPISACDETVAPTIDDAWLQFESKDYAGALTAFQSFFADTSEAYVGAGWSSLRQYQYSQAAGYFANAPSSVDGNAGWGFCLWATGDLNGAISKVDFVLSRSTAYSFSHDPRVNYQDLHVLKANANYEKARYHQCLLSIRQVDPSFIQVIAATDSASVLLAGLVLLGPVL